MEKQENKNQEESKTNTSVKVDIKIHETRNRSERYEKKNEASEPEMVPVSRQENDFTISFELTADKVKNFMKILGQGVGDYVSEKIGGKEED